MTHTSVALAPPLRFCTQSLTYLHSRGRLHSPPPCEPQPPPHPHPGAARTLISLTSLLHCSSRARFCSRAMRSSSSWGCGRYVNGSSGVTTLMEERRLANGSSGVAALMIEEEVGQWEQWSDDTDEREGWSPGLRQLVSVGACRWGTGHEGSPASSAMRWKCHILELALAPLRFFATLCPACSPHPALPPSPCVPPPRSLLRSPPSALPAAPP